MKIKKLNIENYKSLKKVDFYLNEDINVFIGKNNSGKSNLIDALLFLSSLVRSGQDIASAIRNYGGYQELVFSKVKENEVAFDIRFTLTTDDLLTLYMHKVKGLGLRISSDESKRLYKDIRYVITVKENALLREEIRIRYNGKDVLYAQGSYQAGMYQHKIIASLKNGITNGDWSLVSRGGSSPASSILQVSRSPTMEEEKLNLLLRDHITSFVSLSPVRQSPERLPVLGGSRLKPDASNLPQVLNFVASSDPMLLNRIMESVKQVIGEIDWVRAPVIEGTHDTYVSLVEQQYDVEFTWKHIASGTKEIIYLVTVLHTTPRGSLLMIEEPEAHLHPEAISKFLSLAASTCREGNKQMFITTHSPTLIDELPIDKVFTVVKEAGETKVEPLKGGRETDMMLSQAGVPKSWLLHRKAPSFLLIVEGRDDVKIWSKFLERENADPFKVRVVGSGEPGNDKKAIEMGKFLKRARIPTDFKIILDSDNKKEEKEENLEKEGFQQKEYHVLSKKEIEDYLLDAKAISQITPESEEKVNEVITRTSGAGKEKLDTVFKNLNLSKPDTGVKELLAACVDMPKEILSIVNEIKGYLSA